MTQSYNVDQLRIINYPPEGRIFLEGPAGSGKTTIGVERLRNLIEGGIAADEILVLIPQRILAMPYHQLLRHPDFPPGGVVDIFTMAGLAQRMISLFWPMVAEAANFTQASQPPVFLNMETAQYYLAHLVSPLIENEGYFEAVTIDRNRLYGQILDNLNKAAFVGFDYRTIGERLKNAWTGDPVQLRVYEDAQDCAIRFREYCQTHNLLDFSLQFEIFHKYLWSSLICRSLLTRRYRHLIYDNVEEDVPVAHDIVRDWLPVFESALLIFDDQGGYRSFLGADIESGYRLSTLCENKFQFTTSFITPKPLKSFGALLSSAVCRLPLEDNLNDVRTVINLSYHSFVPEMIQWIRDRIRQLLEDYGQSPRDIVILSPFLSDSLRFALMNSLKQSGIPVRSHRPSRSLSEEPAARCLFTLAKVAHPGWGMLCSQEELRNLLMLVVTDMDLVRADILSKIVFRQNSKTIQMGTFSQIQAEMQERITFVIGERYEGLRLWIENYQQERTTELDTFFSKVFGELLSLPGYGFFENIDAATVTSRLVNSVRYFRRVTGKTYFDEELSEYIYLRHQYEEVDTGQEYIKMVESGVLASQFIEIEDKDLENAVMISPANTYLMANRPVRSQFWLDIGNLGWWQRLYQPLTHPHVLSRQWGEGQKWTDADEIAANRISLSRLVKGLVARCEENIYLCVVGVNEQGNEERSPLLLGVQTLIKLNQNEAKHV